MLGIVRIEKISIDKPPQRSVGIVTDCTLELLISTLYATHPKCLLASAGLSGDRCDNGGVLMILASSAASCVPS